jgi:Uma2 family endonuclease
MLMLTKTHGWTVNELDQLPDDGNRYEIVDGELFVTPAPSRRHQIVSAAFWRRVDAFVSANGLGRTFFAPGDVQNDTENRVQPDIFVEPRSAHKGPANWIDAPKPLLVIEILSDSTAHRDLGFKRRFYARAGVPEYWIVDADDRSVLVVRRGQSDVTVRDRIVWQPDGAKEALAIDLAELFSEALDE